MIRQLTLTVCVLASVGVARAEDAKEALWAAARKGDTAAVKKLIDDGVDVNAKTPYGATALSFAADKGHLEVVKLMIQAKADVNVKDTFYNATPLTWANMRNQAAIVRELVAAGATGSDLVFLTAAQGGKLDMVKAVMDWANPTPEILDSAL